VVRQYHSITRFHLAASLLHAAHAHLTVISHRYSVIIFKQRLAHCAFSAWRIGIAAAAGVTVAWMRISSLLSHLGITLALHAAALLWFFISAHSLVCQA